MEGIAGRIVIRFCGEQEEESGFSFQIFLLYDERSSRFEFTFRGRI